MLKHIDKYFPAYFMSILICGFIAVAVRSEMADRAFDEKCKQIGGEPRTVRERLCVRPGGLLEVPRG